MTNNAELIDIEYSLWRLEGLFHKEDHFKLEFGFLLNKLIQEQGITGTVRLEWNTEQAGDVDLAIRTQNGVIPIELKYKTKAADVHDTSFNERFHISRQGDYNHGTYSFIKDISNLEALTQEYDTQGYAIFLTNDPNYWEKREGAVYDPFRIYDGRVLEGEFDWVEERSWKQGDPIHLNHHYKLNWNKYSHRPDIIVEGASEFKSLAVKVPPNSE
ncbi:hypothetical protein [Halorubrum saccharovorum]|uniref:hypothetical protein n=1 Tax=Halorubrum saccharovorum TaxID=2248 RepID=UPI001267A23C|nr:hypothetical protein [Halorubrum saccharovorum]